MHSTIDFPLEQALEESNSELPIQFALGSCLSFIVDRRIKLVKGILPNKCYLLS